MADINPQGPPNQAALDAQLVRMRAAVPRGALKNEYEDVNAAAKHCKSLLNQLSFKPNPIFTWLSTEDTTWSTSKLKHNSSRKLAISLWKDGVFRLVKEPVSQPNAERQTTTPTTAGPSSNTNASNNISGSQALANTVPDVPTPSSKRKGKQPALPSKASKTKGNQDIVESLNRIPSAATPAKTARTVPSSSNANTRMTLRSGKVANRDLQQLLAADRDIPATTPSSDDYIPSENEDEDEDYAPLASKPAKKARRHQTVIPDSEDEGETPIEPIASNSATATRRHRPIIVPEDRNDEQIDPRATHADGNKQAQLADFQSCGLLWMEPYKQLVSMIVDGVEMKGNLPTRSVLANGLIRHRVGTEVTSSHFAYKEAMAELQAFAGSAFAKRNKLFWVQVDAAHRWVKKWGFESRTKLFLSWVDGSIDMQPVAARLHCSVCERTLKFDGNLSHSSYAKLHLALHQGKAKLDNPESVRTCLACRHIFLSVKDFDEHECPGPDE